MFESQDTTPWYRSRSMMIGASVCFAALALALFYHFYGYRYFGDRDAHYTELERHRAQQAARATNESTPAATEQVAASNQNTPAETAGQQPATAAGANGSNAVASNAQDANHPVAPAPSSSSSARNYWTNFRGP
ncbi:MAG TPA: hypothetical protein VGB05_07080, partial [Pyrinomonadaceae bacterium]